MLPEEEIGLPGKFGLMAGKNSTEVSSDLKHYWYSLYGNFSYRINLSFWLRIQPEVVVITEFQYPFCLPTHLVGLALV